MRQATAAAGLTLLATLLATTAHAGIITLTVGSAAAPTLTAAANIANADLNPTNTYDILIPAGIYINDFANVTRPMTIESSGGTVILLANGQLLLDKGIIVTTSSLTVRGLTFTGAAIDQSLGGNGAGIRDQSTGATTLRVEGSSFIGNQDGILTGGSGNQEIVQIIGSTFLDNGSTNGQTHALYVGDALSLLVQGSTFCGTIVGHNIKSRAQTSTVTGTTGFDGATGGGCAGPGSASYDFEFPNGGVVNLDNDTLIQGAFTQNSSMLGYGAEGYPYANNTLSVTNTSFTSANFGTGIQQFGSTGSCTLQNTTFAGTTTNVSPSTFCTIVSPPVTVPEPNLIWLAWMAGIGWTVTFLLMKDRKSRKSDQPYDDQATDADNDAVLPKLSGYYKWTP
jgi:hypothetical protein